jgi:choline kinase
VSSKKNYDSDDMKVTIEMGRLIRIGKQLPDDRVSAESIGLIYFRNQGPEIFRNGLDQALKNPEARKKWYLSVVDKIASVQPVVTCSITGLQWCEIDYPRDLKLAESVISTINPHGHEFRNRNIFMDDDFMQLKAQVG